MKKTTYVISRVRAVPAESNNLKENKMTDEVQQEAVEVVALVARVAGDGIVPYPDTCILPDEWNEFTKAAWHDRQLDAYNVYYGITNDTSS